MKSIRPGKAEVTPSSPLTWLIRNKVDILQGAVERSESTAQKIGRNEQELHPTKPLKNVVSKRSTDRNELKFNKNELVFDISAITGEGFERLLAQLAHHAEGFLAGAELALVTRERHRRTLEDTLAALRRALGGDLAGREDLLAEELRIAARALGRLTGRVDVEDVLDVIFRDFCIGK